MIRWQEIIKSASRQCGRAFFPDLKPPISFEDLIKGATNKIHCALFFGRGKKTIPLKIC